MAKDTGKKWEQIAAELNIPVNTIQKWNKSMLQSWSDPVELEGSTFWTQLHDHFTEYVGKIRLFGHPDVAEVAIAAISHDKFVNIIEGALRYAQR